jgi:hypothetical protein
MKQSEIEMLIKQLNVRPCAEMYGRTLTDILQAQQIQKKSAALRPNLWRFIMKSKITRYSAAAIVTLAMALVLLDPFGTSDKGHIVWAQVVENMDKVQMFAHKEQRFFYELGQDEPFLKTNVIKHACLKYGVVEEQYTTQGDLMHRVYLLGRTRQIVGVLPKVKKYFKLPMTDEMAQLIDRLTPRGLVEYFMSTEHKDLGRSQIDGCQVEGFEATGLWPVHDTFNFLFPVKQITWRFWIDIESSLPVRVDYEIITDRGLFTEMKKLKIVCKAYDFEYHKELQDELFDPNIPDDYTEFKVADFIPIEAKAGLVGLGVVPAGFIIWNRRRRKRAKDNPVKKNHL